MNRARLEGYLDGLYIGLCSRSDVPEDVKKKLGEAFSKILEPDYGAAVDRSRIVATQIKCDVFMCRKNENRLCTVPVIYIDGETGKCLSVNIGVRSSLRELKENDGTGK